MKREDQLKAIQHFGEQHPQFHSKEMKTYRASEKKKAVAKKMAGVHPKHLKFPKLYTKDGKYIPQTSEVEITSHLKKK